MEGQIIYRWIDRNKQKIEKQIGIKEIKWPLFIDIIIIYVEHPMYKYPITIDILN